MKIYFTASIAAKKQLLRNYLMIIDFLKSKKHDVISDHILNTEESQIQLQTKEQRLKFHDQLERWIRSCDFMIAETTFPSISVGYEISLALRVGKPVLIVYSEGYPPSLFAHHKDEKIIAEKYTYETLKPILEDFISYTDHKSDLRFTFFITPAIVNYLDEISRKEKIPKSVYLRKLIEEDMHRKS